MWLSKRKVFDGQILWTYGILYSIGRFVIEYFRGDDRGFPVEQVLSTSQFVGIFIFILSSFMLLMLYRKNSRRHSS
jgi:phosphatidylglycerol:prolipoprotein diacylglycerol transferase